jgi:flagellar basal body P-ring protein FlgI
MMRIKFLLCSLMFCCVAGHALAAARPLGQIVAIEGVRENQLLGYGLVVGSSCLA